MTLFESIILGIVEGVTEFLPISSTGHLILASTLLGIAQSEFAKTFEIAIQLGAMCAVLLLYWRSFFDIGLLKRLVTAFIPTAVIGLIAYPFLKATLLGNNVVVLVSLFVGGVIFIVFEKLRVKAGNDDFDLVGQAITYKQALIIGLCQAIAIIPGVSRSGATIVGGMLLGIGRVAIVEFSFLLAVPTILAATGLDLFEMNTAFTSYDWFVLGVGLLVSFVVALVSIKWLLQYVRNHSYVGFGIYRILISLILAAFLFL